MAKKSLILDNGDGRVALSNTSSVSLDDGAGSNMSASYMTASSLSLSGIGVGQVKILSASNGAFSSAFPNGTVPGGAIAFDGSKWVTSSLLVQDYSGSAYGDLSGSYESGVQVKNISNVNTGTLPVAFGGTGKSLAASQAYILKVSSSAGGTPVISALSASSGSILTTFGGAWTAIPPGYPDVRFYTSGSTGNTFTWTKPAGARFARVILQGAGGGGGGSAGSGTGVLLYNGGGGGAGAFTDITIDVLNVASVTVTTGIGGLGGVYGTTIGNITAGAAGSQTSFISGTISLTAGAGGGGVAGNAANNAAGGSGGAAMSVSNGGYSKTGDAGATGGAARRTVYGICGGGSAGGYQNSSIVVPIISSTSFGYPITADGIDISTLNFIASTSYAGTNGTGPTPVRVGYGAGGSGGNWQDRATGLRADQGGNGYVIVISW